MGGIELVRELAFTVGARGEPKELASLLKTLGRQADEPTFMHYAVLAGLARGFKSRAQTLTALLEKAESPAKERIENLLVTAKRLGADNSHEVVERLPAFDLFPFLPWDQVRAPLFSALSPQEPRDVQLAALKSVSYTH